ncbi:hypothetical protein AB4Z21_32440, partial [Paenibacillus sp. MCAF20]
MGAKPSDLIGRIGGDEFVLIVPCSQESDVDELINSRLGQLSKNAFIHESTAI